ncbi:MAG: exodeoxyribonuclease VII small subunit [Thermodesulfobacteriota bacterium]
MPPPETEGFNKNYQILKEIADKFRRQANNENSVPDIDSLVDDIERATQAYRQCKNRLEEVGKKLDSLLPRQDGEFYEQVDDEPGEMEDSDDLPF